MATYLVIETTGGLSVADGPRSVVDADDAATAAQSVAETGTGVGRYDFQVFDVSGATAVSNEAVRSVQPVVVDDVPQDPPADVPQEDPADPPADNGEVI